MLSFAMTTQIDTGHIRNNGTGVLYTSIEEPGFQKK